MSFNRGYDRKPAPAPKPRKPTAEEERRRNDDALEARGRALGFEFPLLLEKEYVAALRRFKTARPNLPGLPDNVRLESRKDPGAPRAWLVWLRIAEAWPWSDRSVAKVRDIMEKASMAPQGFPPPEGLLDPVAIVEQASVASYEKIRLEMRRSLQLLPTSFALSKSAEQRWDDLLSSPFLMEISPLLLHALDLRDQRGLGVWRKEAEALAQAFPFETRRLLGPLGGWVDELVGATDGKADNRG